MGYFLALLHNVFLSFNLDLSDPGSGCFAVYGGAWMTWRNMEDKQYTQSLAGMWM